MDVLADIACKTCCGVSSPSLCSACVTGCRCCCQLHCSLDWSHWFASAEALLPGHGRAARRTREPKATWDCSAALSPSSCASFWGVVWSSLMLGESACDVSTTRERLGQHVSERLLFVRIGSPTAKGLRQRWSQDRGLARCGHRVVRMVDVQCVRLSLHLV